MEDETSTLMVDETFTMMENELVEVSEVEIQDSFNCNSNTYYYPITIISTHNVVVRMRVFGVCYNKKVLSVLV